METSASTARTLNLITVWKKHGEEEEYKAKPFFDSVALNRSIILKHRLRANERDVFGDERTSATKVILPIDLMDMRSGAQSFFIGERAFQNFLVEISRGDEAAKSRDTDLLLALDELPSLDPFLMRERLKKAGLSRRPATSTCRKATSRACSSSSNRR